MTHKTEDVVDLLLAQHDEIRRLASQVESNHGVVRRDAFDRLRRLLAVHETAEEEVVHPYARRSIDHGDQVIEKRLKEENAAKGVLAQLEKLDCESPEFEEMFTGFHKDLDAHARREEREEFPKIRREASEEQLRGMATMVRVAEAVAPTHPHQGVESPAKNLALGPFAAVMDRAKDAIAKARR